MLEREYQANVIRKLNKLFPDCVIMKNDSGYKPGFPDLTIFYKDMWAVLEVKKEKPKLHTDFEPNQEWYLEFLNPMSFAACIYPENEEEVIHELQQAFQSGRPACLPQRQQLPLGTIF